MSPILFLKINMKSRNLISFYQNNQIILSTKIPFIVSSLCLNKPTEESIYEGSPGFVRILQKPRKSLKILLPTNIELKDGTPQNIS